MPGKESIADLRKDYRAKRKTIESRLAEFRKAYRDGDDVIFEELCFCIVTAGSSARMGMKTIAALRDILHIGSESELQKRAGAHRLRFWRIRPSYMYHTREYLRGYCGMRLRELLESFETRSREAKEFGRIDTGNLRIVSMARAPEPQRLAPKMAIFTK